MGFGIIAGAMGGLGQGMVNEAETLRKQDEIKQRYQSETDLMTLRANLEEGKAKALADYNEVKTIATEQRKVAPLKRVGEAAKEIAGKEVPLQGSDVQSLEGGKGNAFDGQPLETKGMQGNVGIIMKQMEDGIKNETDPATKQQKIQDFENIKKQMGSQQDAEAEGKTRTVGNDEAVKIALDKLKVSDPEAYAAYETTIGKSLRDERKLDNQANAAEIKDRRERELAMMRDATTRYAADLRSADSDKRLEALIGRLGGGQSGTKEALTFIDGQRKEIAAESAELRQLQKQSMEMGQDPAKVSAEFAPKFAALQRKRDQIEADFGSLREQVGLPASNQIKQSTPSTPGTKQNGWNSDTGDVYVNGEIIGKATNVNDARALASGKPKSIVTGKREQPSVQRELDSDGIPLPKTGGKMADPYGFELPAPYRGKAITTPFNPN